MIVLVRCCCNAAIIPWVECLLANRSACGIPRLYQFSYPMPFRSVFVCGLSFVFFGLFVFRVSALSWVSFVTAFFGFGLGSSRVPSRSCLCTVARRHTKFRWLFLLRERAEKEDCGDGCGVKNAATLTRGAATPSGAFKLKELIVRSLINIKYYNYN